MATNKNATIRYQTLDRCFRNPGKKYFIEDLIEKCNESLLDIDPNSTGIKRRQLYDDIKFMRDSHGFDAPIEAYKEGRKVYYRYDDMSFSINNQPLNEQEAQQLQESLLTLSRFKGMPQFEWIEELSARLEQSFNLKSDKQVISFEDNPYLTGREHISTIYNAIVNETALFIEYQSFKKEKPYLYDFHPYHLKQFNNRWFLFGRSTGNDNLTNLALDRIASIEVSKTKYIPNTTFDFDDFFYDVIGVSVPSDRKAQEVVLKIDADLWPYIKTKPIHGSQKIKSKTDSEITIKLYLKINYELIALIFSYLDSIEIIEPSSLREKCKTISKNIFLKYD